MSSIPQFDGWDELDSLRDLAPALAPAPSPADAPATQNPPAPADPTPPAEPGGVAVRQGDRFTTDRGMGCTIGYVDKARGVAYTAHHCGKAGYHNTRGVYVEHNGVSTRVGTMVYAHPYLPEVGLLPPEVLAGLDTTDRDIAAIKFVPGVTLSDNSFSSDTRVPLNQVHAGETACFYGSTTGHPVCGRVRSVSSPTNPLHRILVEVPQGATTAQPGDSGGAAYIPGRGSIGIVKGSWSIPDKEPYGFAVTGF